jgi:polar amino acid transport system substrate-binding protein
VQQGKVDLLCGADSVTLTRMKDVAFTIPVFPGGIGVMLRSESSILLREVLNNGPSAARPIWRGAPARTLLDKQTFSAVAGTTSEGWLKGRIAAFQLDATVTPVATYEAGVQKLLSRETDVFFGDRAILVDAAKRGSGEELIVLDRLFTFEPVALVFKRGDDDFRVALDRSLSRIYAAPDFNDLYAKWFGKPDSSTVTFFRATALPE